jgi:hypothetical protein
MSDQMNTKLLSNIKVGDSYDASVTVSERPDGSLLFVAACGETRAERVMRAHPNHEYTEEQFAKDVETEKLSVAREAAGHEHQRLLRKKFFGAEAGKT